jgi:hypothetical protein
MSTVSTSISRDNMDKRISLLNPHNHGADNIDLHVP